jgi:predicted HTH transcriptional regulator
MMTTETNRIEYKRELSDDLEQEVVAFLNSGGGDIVIGICDDGRVAGVQNPDKIQLQIADRLKDNIRPSIMGLFDILVGERDGKTIITVNLAGGLEKPYCIKRKGYGESGCFIRVGSSSQPMPQAMIEKWMARRHQPSIANMPSRHQDLEFTQLKLYYGLKNKPLNDNFARTLDFLTPEGKYNMVAFLFADNNNISLRIGKYAGKDKLDLIEREDYKDCCLITAMQKVLDRFDIENITLSRKRPMQSRLDTRLVDSGVVHEAIINAFAHNDYSRLDTPIFQIYSDRFEITSFGGLVDGLSLEKFYEGTSIPRNREIMRIFKDLDFVEQLGSGVPQIIEKYGRGVFSVSENVVQTILRLGKNAVGGDGESPGEPKTNGHEKGKKRARKGQENERAIFEAIIEDPASSISELAEELSLTIKTVRGHLDKLKAAGRIRRIGPDKGGHWEVVK